MTTTFCKVPNCLFKISMFNERQNYIIEHSALGTFSTYWDMPLFLSLHIIHKLEGTRAPNDYFLFLKALAFLDTWCVDFKPGLTKGWNMETKQSN